MDNRIGIIMPSSTWTMAWLHRQNPRWLLGAFSTLVGLVDNVVLRNNSGNTVGMV